MGRSGLTEELWDNLVAAVRRGRGAGKGGLEEDEDTDEDEEEERIEAEALEMLRAALEGKLAAALAGALSGGGGSSGGGVGLTARGSGGDDAREVAMSRRAKCALDYREGVVAVLRGAVAECEAMAAGA